VGGVKESAAGVCSAVPPLAIPDLTVAVIPAYDPNDALCDIVADLTGAGMRAVVVDDGSSPECQPVFDAVETKATVLRHPENQGKGAALRTALAWVEEHFPADTLVVTVDADGQHLPADVMRVCLAASDPADDARSVVLGARLDDESTPVTSRIGHVITRGAFWMATGKRLTDTQTGLRAFRADLIPFLLGVPGQRYEYEMNMLLGLVRDRVPVKEVGIATVYDDPTTSHYRHIVDSLRIGRDLIAFSASSFVSFLIDYSLFSLGTLAFGALGLPNVVVWANVVARAGSATVNYTINKRFVFRRTGNVPKTALQYAGLVVAILIANTAVLSLLTGPLGINPWLAKVGVELLFFTVSWLVQHRVIFAPAKGEHRG